MDLGALGARAEDVDPTIPTVASRTLHFDGDYAAYYFSGNDDTPLMEAQRNLERFVESKARITGSSRIAVHLTADWSDKGQRFKLATVKPYQGQRDSGRRPKNWAAMRNYMERAVWWDVLLWDDREADDGVAFYSFQSGWENTAILTRDKDFRMIPGIHVGWMHERIVHLPDGKPWETSILATWDNDESAWFGRQWFLLQLLQGDTADNIPGLPKVPLGKGGKPVACGPVAAEKWLATASSDPVDAVVLGYQAHYKEKWAEALAEQASLLWMRGFSKDPADFLGVFKHVLEYPAIQNAIYTIVEERCA